MSNRKNVSGTSSENLRLAPSNDDEEVLPFRADAWNELEKAGKAFDYENRNWKNRTRILFCTESEAAPFFRTPADESRFELARLGGLVSALPTQRRGKTLQHLWVRETNEAGTALKVLVHEAIHAASFALAARRIPLDLRNGAAGDCVGFFVEDILTQALPFFEMKLGIEGADLPRRGTRKDRLAVRGGKGATLKTMKKLGVAFEHEDTTWRAWVMAAVCNADDAPPLFANIVESDARHMDEDTGRVWFAETSSQTLVWADGSRGARAAYASLVHGAIHAAGRILANCGVDVDLAKTGSSECVAYFVERFFENIWPWFLSRFAATLRMPGPAATAAC